MKMPRDLAGLAVLALLRRALFVFLCASALLWATAEHFDDEPLIALTLAVLVAAYDYLMFSHAWKLSHTEEERRGVARLSTLGALTFVSLAWLVMRQPEPSGILSDPNLRAAIERLREVHG